MSISSVKTGAIGVSLLAGNDFYDPARFYSIATVNGTGSSGTITFSSIPSTYSHLQIRFNARSTYAGTLNQLEMTVNGDTGSNYVPYHLLYGDGSTVGSVGSTTNTRIVFNDIPAATSLANTFMPGIIDILDYGSTNKYKTVKILYGRDFNGSGQMMFGSGLWMSTSAISSLSIYVTAGGNFNSYSQFALYGVKA
jgi:hypothetical protein